MNEELANITRQGLADLQHASGADLLTCYFLNPHSGLLWLFHREGQPKYDGQLHGPLTYPSQTHRIIKTVHDYEIGEHGIHFFDPPPPTLTETIGHIPFLVREGIVRTIWIVFPSHKDDSQESAPDCHPEPRVFIFLNYRTKDMSAWEESTRPAIEARVPLLKHCLLQLVNQPCIQGDEAWRLRNMSLQFFRELEKVLIGGIATTTTKMQGLYDFLTEQAFWPHSTGERSQCSNVPNAG